MKAVFRNMPIMHSINDGKVIVCYNQFDMGNKYKIYKKVNDTYTFVYSEQSITKAVNYAKNIFVA